MKNRKLFLLFTRGTACALLLLWSSFQIVVAQQLPSAAPKRIAPFPIIPLIAEYNYVPLSFMQWVNDDPHYSRITAAVDQSEPPVYLVMLSEKSGADVYYCNSKPKIESLRARGKQAHLTSIDFKMTRNVGQPNSYGFGFRDAHGRAILWRFLPATRPSERGAELVPQPAAPGLRLMYRNLGTAAGAGTAVQIGDHVSEAEPWPQISAPPYFVAYRGSHAEGMDDGAMLIGSETWSVTTAPEITDVSELREGAEWTLREKGGRVRTLRVTARRADEVTITEVNAETRTASKLELIARVLPQGFALREMRLTGGERSLRISFMPELNLANAQAGANNGSGGGDVNFEITLGNNRKVTQGSISIERQDGVLRLRWMPKSPQWARSRAFVNTIKMDAGGYMIDASQPAELSRR